MDRRISKGILHGSTRWSFSKAIGSTACGKAIDSSRRGSNARFPPWGATIGERGRMVQEKTQADGAARPGAGEVLIISTKEAQGLISPEECYEAMEIAYSELGRGIAQYIPRRRMYIPLDKPDHYYWHNNIPGVVPHYNTVALRIDSAQVRAHEVNGLYRMDFPGDFAGFVLLFYLDTRELYAVIHDHALSAIRVAATSAIASKRLARPESEVMGLFGAGEQAKAQLLAHTSIFPKLKKVKLYVTTESKRAQAAKELSELSGIEVEPVNHPKDAVSGCDIVTTATNSSDPVFSGEWLEPGQHVNTMIGSDFFIKRREIDDETVRRAEIIVINTRLQAQIEEQPQMWGPVRKGWIKWENVYDLGDLVNRKVNGRSHNTQITLHDNNVGMGIQFAASGAILAQNAREKGVGTTIPADLFMTRRSSQDEVFAP
jgi:alanine dehydrogenase